MSRRYLASWIDGGLKRSVNGASLPNDIATEAGKKDWLLSKTLPETHCNLPDCLALEVSKLMLWSIRTVPE